VHQADWMAPRLRSWEGGYTVTIVVPAGFEAYARVLHPAQIPDSGHRLVRWAEVAAWSGMPLRPDAQFHSVEHINAPRRCRVVGVDLAGYETIETRAAYFATEFTAIHRCGIAITAHAGENDDAEGIWQAVFKLHARRLGHALHLHRAPDLHRTVIERRIGVEMCPFANYQIKGFAPMPNRPQYPLLDYLREGVPVTANTDNIGISAASLSDNLLLLPRLCPGITRLEILQLQANALDVAFVSHPERQEIRRQMEAFLGNGPVC
jgi:adenosine deaminase